MSGKKLILSHGQRHMIDIWTYNYLMFQSVQDVVRIATYPDKFRTRSERWLDVDEQDRVINACVLISGILNDKS